MSELQQLPDIRRDVQGNILSKYDARCATYLFYRVDLPELARMWLSALISRITTEANAEEKPQSMLNIALSYQGLKALGLSPTSLNSCPAEFREGMKKRAGTLCDFGESAPARWEAPLGSLQVHILVLIHGLDRKRCADLADWVNLQIPKSSDDPVGVHLLKEMTADGLEGDKEHFGFKDGISQPWIEGTNPGPPVQPYGGKRVQPPKDKRTLEDSFAPLKLGEFVLGHIDELDRIPQPLTPPILGSNGTYLVLRKLSQDVAGFRQQMEKQAGHVFGDPAAKDRLAALTVGRWPSGCPIDRSWEKDDPQFTTPQSINAFAFVDGKTGQVDQDGIRCPVDAHIRRTNPRDLKLDDKGNLAVEPMSTRHRMIRRSLPYGPPLETLQDDNQDRGLMFTALVADIERQFEFVQRNWVNDGDPFRLDRRDRDPLIGNNRDQRDAPSQNTYLRYSEFLAKVLGGAGIMGAVTRVDPKPTTVDIWYRPSPGTRVEPNEGLREKLELTLQVDRVDILPHPDGVSTIFTISSFMETKRKFTVPAATRLPWALNLPEFVTTRGGEYFFLPSVTALKGIAGGAFSSFTQEYTALGAIYGDPSQRSLAQSKLISDWLILRPKEMLGELLALATGEHGKIFQMPGYQVFGPAPYSISSITIVTKHQDVLEVLDSGKHPEMSVELYRQKMEVPPPRPPRGPFILGRATSDPFYKLEEPILAGAVAKNINGLPGILKRILDDVFNGILKKGSPLDVVQDIAWPVPLGINAKYFGVPGPDQATMKRWLRDIYKDLFLNLRRIPEWSKAADLATAEMNHYLDGMIQEYDMTCESVLKELILAQENPPPGLAPYFVRRNIVGLTVGVVETTLKAVARTIDQLIRHPVQLKNAQAAAKNNDGATVLQYVLEAMRFNPQNHVLFRMCGADTTVAKDTPRETIIKKGTLVFASTLTAMFDPEGPFKQPADFKLDRKPNEYLFFGSDGHECMGRHLAPMVIQEIFMRLLTRLPDLRRSNDDQFDPLDLLPEHFFLEFTP